MSDTNEIELTRVDLNNFILIWTKIAELIQLITGDVRVNADGNLQEQIDAIKENNSDTVMPVTIDIKVYKLLLIPYFLKAKTVTENFNNCSKVCMYEYNDMDSIAVKNPPSDDDIATKGRLTERTFNGKDVIGFSITR